MYNDYLTYAAIEPYNAGEYSFNYITIATTYLRGFGLVLRVTPIERYEKERCNLFGETEEEFGIQIVNHQMKRFSQSKFEDICTNVKAHKESISALWNQRNFDGIKDLLSTLIP